MRFVLQFFAEWIDFRFAEFDALLCLHNLAPSDVYDSKTAQNHCKSGLLEHFFIVELPDENVAVSICSRSVLIKTVHELWCEGSDLPSLIEKTRLLSEDFLKPFLCAINSWSVNVDSFGKSVAMKEKESIRSAICNSLNFLGSVKLENADVELWITLDCSKKLDVDVNDVLQKVPAYLGRFVAKGGMRNERLKYDLKKRLYLGPTSLDDSLALILANICSVRKGTIAFDPFVGTASILVALSHFGAVCMGSDIDPRVLRGEMYAGKADRVTDHTKRDIFENFKDYGFSLPELIRMDNHLLDSHFSTVKDGFVDVIVTDPPYGIRAGAKKSGKSKPVDYTVDKERRFDHIPSTQHYPVEEVMLDLMHTAARMLCRGGILAYLIPTTYDFSESDLPIHPCLELKLICHQGLSTRHGRRAVVMHKHQEYTENLRREFGHYKAHVLSGQDEGFGKLMTKLKAALAADAHENEIVVKQSSACSQKRKASKERRRKQREDGIFFQAKGILAKDTSRDSDLSNI